MPLFHSGNKMSPAILLIILLVSILLFISGLLVLVLKLLKKRRLSSILQSTSRNYDISSTSNALQRQLHQLFNVYDSGLDQSLIDVLPMFIYKDVCGLDGPFDCPVCLCEFSHEDKLRLLPLCKHAFHLDCIDTWLLSNSTCPLCRGTLFAPENPSFGLDDDDDDDANADEIVVAEKRVFSLRLGKFKHMNQDIEMGETSNINLDGRRCFSMGSVQYVVSDKEFQVALCPNRAKRNDDDDEKGGNEVVEFNNNNQKVLNNDGKKISNGSKRESFSISKVWLWPKKSKIPDEGDNHFSKPVNVCLPSSTRDTIQSTTGEALCTCKIIHENLDPKYCKCSFSQLNHAKDENLNLV